MNDSNLTSVLESLQQRLQRLEDKEAITTLLNHYCRVCDTHDFESFGNTFTEDGVLHYEEWGEIHGPAEIAKAASVEGHIQGLQHSITNLQIEITGADTATATASLIFFAAPDTSKPFECYACGGPYEFTFRRTCVGWKITRHKLHRNWAMGHDPSGTFSNA
ncbi:nuclear transport factor 2 family protein [Pseudomonas kermanshahensis]|uniref:Nuclear transport factor 2 family protein n=1 Tax=Pseudomonas kermanshahensis TaxID=2745482 RepID=A0ABU8R072_9PSED